MRDEIVKAIKRQIELQQKLDIWTKEQADPASFPSEDHPISQEKRSNYLGMEKSRYRFQSCLAMSSYITETWVDGATLVFAKWDSSEAEVVIEFSFYGPIVFLSSYGNVPEDVTKEIQHCLDQNKLIKLNDGEIKELEERGLFNSFF